MIIKQSKITNLSKLSSLKPNTKILIVATITEEKTSALYKLGFTQNLSVGETILPGIIGPATKRNANGRVIIHRDKEKEEHSSMIEWTYQQWAGRGRTQEVTISTSRPYKRYPRTFITPLALEFKIIEINGSKVITSPEIVFCELNEEVIITAINVLLEAFSECEVLDSNKNPIVTSNTIRLNWEILPKGKYPWQTQKERIEPFLRKAKGTNYKVISKRLEEINKYNPEFTAIGLGGFSGYIVFGFKTKNLYVLESTQINNATYILNKDWESISKLSKAEILNNELHLARVIHNEYWYSAITEFIS